MIFERNLGYFLIIASFAVLGGVVMSALSPLAQLVAGCMFAGGLHFVRQVRLEIELIKGRRA